MQYIIATMASGFAHPTATQNPITGGVTIGTQVDHSALLVATELSVMIREPNNIQDMSDLWDSKDQFDYGTRGKGLVSIDRPCVSLLGGSSPAWLNRAIPPDAVGGGFTRRVLFPYVPARAKDVPWPDPVPPDKELVEDLRYINHAVHGEMVFENAAKPLFESYYIASKMDAVEDEAIGAFKVSKWVHAAKLAMVLSASYGDQRVITTRIMKEAIDAVEGILADIPHVFKRVGETDLIDAGQRVIEYIEAKGYATRQEIMHALWRYIGPSENLTKILSTFIDAQMIMEVNSGGAIAYKKV